MVALNLDANGQITVKTIQLLTTIEENGQTLSSGLTPVMTFAEASLQGFDIENIKTVIDTALSDENAGLQQENEQLLQEGQNLANAYAQLQGEHAQLNSKYAVLLQAFNIVTAD